MSQLVTSTWWPSQPLTGPLVSPRSDGERKLFLYRSKISCLMCWLEAEDRDFLVDHYFETQRWGESNCQYLQRLSSSPQWWRWREQHSSWTISSRLRKIFWMFQLFDSGDANGDVMTPLVTNLFIHNSTWCKVCSPVFIAKCHVTTFRPHPINGYLNDLRHHNLLVGQPRPSN